MEELLFQRAIEGRGHLDADIQHVEFVHAAFFFDAVVEAAGVGEFHHEELLLVHFVEGVDVDDVGVIEAGGRTGFAIERLHRTRVFRHLLLHQLHRHQPLQHRVERPYTEPMPPAAMNSRSSKCRSRTAIITDARICCRNGLKLREVAGDEVLGTTPAARHHF